MDHDSHDHHHQHAAATFPTETAGLEEARATQDVTVADGGSVDLTIAPVAKRIGHDTVRMLAYNGSIPGPTLRVRQASTITVNVTNEGDLANTVHWHGLRLDNRYDGTHETQAPIPVGGSFAYELTFPDAGVYWYHPHVREDYGQELGLYGNIVVEPAEEGYWPPAHREVALTLDDVLIEDGAIAPFRPDETTHAAMGRFGNVFLTGGETEPTLTARAGEVVRFYLTNTANTRVFNVAFAGARMKLVGGDSGRCEREEIVESIVLAPSERAVVDVLFAEPGAATLEHRTPERTYDLARVEVSDERAEPLDFETLRVNPEWAAERERLARYADAAPDKTLGFIAELDLGVPEGPVVYMCPMHPEVVSEEPGTCPKCGMKLLATAAPQRYVCPMHPDVVSEEPGSCPKCGMKLLSESVVEQAGGHHEHEHAYSDHESHDSADGIEWEDDMVDVNRMTTSANTRWKVVDRDTGAVNHQIDWQFRVGDLVKLRLVNAMEGDHPMHHPFHIHGAGRFVVLARDGVPQENLVWKDTVLVRAGETVDILLELTNAGRWMAHCHIAEHHESGMMFSFDVLPA
jgi:FtsP/CotA-like multicopper oxidase with cupredoxin domain